MRTLVWFRGKDLRVTDHIPLAEAAAAGEVVCAFVLDPFYFGPNRARKLPHRMQFLLESIDALANNLERRGSRLILAFGKAVEAVPWIVQEARVDRVVAQRATEPLGRWRDERVRAALDVPLHLFEGETLAPIGTVVTGSGTSYSVFTPFARAFRDSVRIGAPRPAPARLVLPEFGARVPSAALPSLQDLGIEHNPQLLRGGEPAARDRLSRFIRGPAKRYDVDRDRLDIDGSSRLSVDLKFGTLSPRTVWTVAERALSRSHPPAWHGFSNELMWREFARSVLDGEPDLLSRPHRPEFRTFPWADDPRSFGAWCVGKTGYPIVDAAARQLLATGFVHNRARMIAASFLTKDLLVDYRCGEAHYMKYLTDGDWAQNNFGWQWTAGSGFDAAPYFRVFNPVAQGKKFDPRGSYVRRWVPELRRLPERWIHAPWTAPAAALAEAGVSLGDTYPRPILDHDEARARYLAMVSSLAESA